MGESNKDQHRPWLAYALEESLDQALLAPRDVVDHANPEVLVNQLPPPVISVLLSRALAIGTFSAAQVLESAPPALLAEHLNPEVMWRCLKDAAERGGISRKGGARTESSRRWFASVVGRALESQLITPTDVLRHMPPAEFVGAAPRSVLVELLKEGLGRSTFNAELVLQHITPLVIAENLETSLVWECLAEAAARHFELGTAAATAAKPTPAASVAPAARPAVKAVEKPTVERRAPNAVISDEKTPAPLGPVAALPKPQPVAPMAARPAVGPAAAPPRAVGAPIPQVTSGTPTARHADSELTPADDGDRLAFAVSR
jgi:hypothetical protein